jgi:hypothetical protein
MRYKTSKTEKKKKTDTQNDKKPKSRKTKSNNKSWYRIQGNVNTRREENKDK